MEKKRNYEKVTKYCHTHYPLAFVHPNTLIYAIIVLDLYTDIISIKPVWFGTPQVISLIATMILVLVIVETDTNPLIKGYNHANMPTAYIFL